MDGEHYIRSLSDSELDRMVNLNNNLYTEQELQIALDEVERRSSLGIQNANLQDVTSIEAPATDPEFSEKSILSKPDELICENCGCNIPAGALYCPDCGEAVKVHTKQANGKHNLMSIVRIVVFLVAGCVLAVHLAMNSSKHNPVDMARDILLPLDEYSNMTANEFKQKCRLVDSNTQQQDITKPVYLHGSVVWVTGETVRVELQNDKRERLGKLFEIDCKECDNVNGLQPNDKITVYGFCYGSGSYSTTSMNKTETYKVVLMYAKYIEED